MSGRKTATFRFRTTDYRMYSDAPTTPASTPSTLRPEHIKSYANVSPAVEPGAWQYVTLIWNGPAGRIRFHVRGELQRELAISPGTRTEFARGLDIGTNRIAGCPTGMGGSTTSRSSISSCRRNR